MRRAVFFLTLLIALHSIRIPVWATESAVSAPPAQSFNWAQLGLSGEQKTTIQQYDEVWRRAYEQLYPAIAKEREHLRSLLFADESDTEAIESSLKRLAASEEELRYEAIKNFLDKKNTLTPKQRQHLKHFLSTDTRMVHGQ